MGHRRIESTYIYLDHLDESQDWSTPPSMSGAAQRSRGCLMSRGRYAIFPETGNEIVTSAREARGARYTLLYRSHRGRRNDRDRPVILARAPWCASSFPLIVEHFQRMGRRHSIEHCVTSFAIFAASGASWN